MNNRLLSVFGFGVIVAAIASFILYRLISTRMVANASVPTSQVVVASRDLPLGTFIKDGDVKLIGWTGSLPAGVSSRPEEILGRGVISGIVQGEPVIESRLAAKGAGAGLAATIPPGMRAVAVSVNEVVGVAGFVVPGMRVDLLISGNPPGGNTAATGTRTRTLLQNLQVLSAGQNIQQDAEGKPIPVQVVNLLATPDQAEILSLASHETRIQLVLRNPMDQEVAKTSGTAMANLFGSDVKATNAMAPTDRPRRVPSPQPVKVAMDPKPQERVATPPIIVEIIHGSQKKELRFQQEPEAKP